MKHIYLFIICTITIIGRVFAQTESYTTDSYTERLLNGRYKIDFQPPKEFVESELDTTFRKFISPDTYHSDVYLALQSKNQACLITYTTPRWNIFVPSELIRDTVKTWSQARAEILRLEVSHDIKRVMGREVNLDDYLTVLPRENRVTTLMNADSVYIYHMPVRSKELMPYTHCVAVIAMRYPYIIVKTHLFFTDEEYEKSDEYLSAMYATIRYQGDREAYTDIGTKPDPNLLKHNKKFNRNKNAK